MVNLRCNYVHKVVWQSHDGPLSSQFPQGNGPRLRMVWISNIYCVKDKPSLMFSRMMILITPATTDREYTRVSFKWFSWKTLMFSLCYFGLGAVPHLVSYLTGLTSQMSSLDQTGNVIDTGSQFANIASIVASQTFPFFLASGIPSISQLALAKDFTIPKYGLVFILGRLLMILAGIAGNTCSVRSIFEHILVHSLKTGKGV